MHETTKSEMNELKKELKGWENMFLRKHGRKPTKVDVENSSDEIRAAYREYQQLKRKETADHHHHPLCESPASDTVLSELQSNSNVAEATDGVFAPSLNKKHSAKPGPLTAQMANGDKTERNPIWNLRKLCKDESFTTVRISGRALRGECNKTCEREDHEKEDSSQSGIERKNIAGSAVSVAKELEILQEVVKIKSDSNNSHHSTGEPLPMAGYYSHQSRASSRRPKISAEWMERCYRDLSKPSTGETLLSQDTLVTHEGTGLRAPRPHGGLSNCDTNSANQRRTMPSVLTLLEGQMERPVMGGASCSEGGYEVRIAGCQARTQDVKTEDRTTLKGVQSEKGTVDCTEDRVALVQWPADDQHTMQVVNDNQHTAALEKGSCYKALEHEASHSSSPETYPKPCLEAVASRAPQTSKEHSAEGISCGKLITPGEKFISPSEKFISLGEKLITPGENVDGSLQDGGDNTTAKAAAKSSGRSKSVSENFVRLNMKVKRYSKNVRRVTGAAYKRQKWKAYHKALDNDGGKERTRKAGNTCFKCGQPGHWASSCTEREGSKNLGQFAGEVVRDGEEEEEGMDEMDPTYLAQLSQESPFPTVDEAAMMARGIKHVRRRGTDPTGDGNDMGQQYFPPPPSFQLPSTNVAATVEPLFISLPSATPSHVTAALRDCGHQSFRAGQEEAVLRILAGMSTLLVLPTGAGKSLCYQLPAYLYSQRSQCITLVISPLISLMEDQIRHLPPCLRGACLHANLTHTQREKVTKDVNEGKIDILLLSPEALVGGANWGGWSIHSLSRLPPVAFACIDEAHCLSSWSHNFRPSYLRILWVVPSLKVLKERLGVSCVLAITATATKSTATSISSHLNIAPENIIRGTALPENLNITVSCADDKEKALVQLLQGHPYSSLPSVIVYCTRQQQTERVAQVLRTCLQMQAPSEEDENTYEEEEGKGDIRGKRKGKKSTVGSKAKRQKIWSAECYHAGLSASQRRKVQSDFMAGKLRIVVATVAFGMGLNKSDVRAVIHYNMPKSFEAYVQEIGRAGRDGLAAYCHAFTDSEGSDLAELLKHLNGNMADWFTVKQLIKQVFPECRCREFKGTKKTLAEATEESLVEAIEECLVETTEEITCATGTELTEEYPKPGHYVRCCEGHEVSIVIETLVQTLDVSEECLSTLLCYLELDGWVEVLNPVLDTCTLKCYGGHRQLRALAAKVPSVAAAVARLKEKGVELETASTLSFSVTSVSDSMGWQSSIVRSELRGLQNNDRGTSGKPSLASSVMVEFSELSYHLRCPGDLTNAHLDDLCNQLYTRIKSKHQEEVNNLHLLHGVLKSSIDGHQLKCLIQLYFEDSLNSETLARAGVAILKPNCELSAELRAQISKDVRCLVGTHSDRSFTGRAIARIFSGISSPCYPAEVWGRKANAWRKYISVDFEQLCQQATRELLAMRGH